ncbi:hypothetical protein J6590_084189 [Homalodisca vitripennis]|nr:hypothetical protein J6590_084189 [Homalodisca vitripennis]
MSPNTTLRGSPCFYMLLALSMFSLALHGEGYILKVVGYQNRTHWTQILGTPDYVIGPQIIDVPEYTYYRPVVCPANQRADESGRFGDADKNRKGTKENSDLLCCVGGTSGCCGTSGRSAVRLVSQLAVQGHTHCYQHNLTSLLPRSPVQPMLHSRLWRWLCDFLEVIQHFFMASCCPGLDGLDDDDEEETENLLQDDRIMDPPEKNIKKAD